ncbi:uncharacterized protein LOC123532922 [Mercenaria mercenaria]|uniref:uncharacterized protein LOC123532922 n=1 Tax=Mercenaria mercenaria TaxID=6596 RepID=UPI00234F68CB|nr:uncharacterized protein LOC123532922 [Mercenaria mercenaria]
MLQHLCPGAKVCRENQTMQAQEREFWPGQTSCCTECSCGSDCKENGNCCFPTMQSYTSENEDYDHVLQNKRVCLYPTTLDLQEKQKVSFQSYYMISSVSSDIENNSSSSCGDTPVALWGSLFPVYSAKRNQIYKNIACATADGVTDGRSWEVLLTCRADRDGRSMLLEPNDYVYRVVNSDFNYKNCHISFIFKGSMEEIKHLQCHRDVTDVCPDFGLFQITDDIGFSEKEIIEGCTSGLVSPYRMEKMYANVFCHICNKERFRMNVTCPVISSALALRGPLTTSFSGIIDAEIFLKKSRTNVDVIKPKTPIACSKQNVSVEENINMY